MRALLALFLLLSTVPAYAQDAEDSPEPPLPKPPAEMPLASPGPVVVGPDARELLVEQCKDQDFVECFKKWRPPPPPPPAEPEKKEAKAAEPPPPPRKKTRPTKGSVERRLKTKSGRSTVKKLRSRVDGD